MTEIINKEAKKGIWESPYFVMVVLMLGVFMMALDMYVFAPALPTIVGDFKTSFDWVAWTMTIYMLFSTAVMPLGGKLSDVFGRKRVYIAGVLLLDRKSVV
jgi:MFS family permease